MLSAIVHGQDIDVSKAVQIAHTACLAIDALDAERQTLYLDLIQFSLSRAARREWEAMNPGKREYLSDFAKNYFSQGEAKGEARGRAALVLKQLTARFGSLSDDIQSRVSQASVAELDDIGERLLTATSLQDALRPQ